jgi:hypothetical protein
MPRLLIEVVLAEFTYTIGRSLEKEELTRPWQEAVEG